MESSTAGTFAEKYDLYGCFQCGKCTGGCPISLKSKLNIRRLMLEGILGKNLDRMREKEELWECTTCKTCTLRCPREMKPMDLIIGMRSELVIEGHIPKTIIEALEAIYKYGNPWGKPKNKRTEWIKGLPENVKVKDLSQGEQAEYLFYVGCTGSFDPRIQEITKSLVVILQHAGNAVETKCEEWEKPASLRSLWNQTSRPLIPTRSSGSSPFALMASMP
jgi:heterodisulfide reductase subunit C